MKQLNPETLKSLVGIVLGLVISVLCFSLGWQCSRNPETPEKTETVTKTDTVTQWKTKTVSVNRPIPVYSTVTKTVHDTLPIVQYHNTTDTVYASVDVPISTQKYSDEQVLQDSTKVAYNAVVSGYRASLDSLQFKVTYPERTINTSTVTTSTKRKHFGIGPSVGCGYGLTTKKFDCFVGLSVTISF
jgi:hypothetical protein